MAAILLEEISDGRIDPDQAGFWTREWQDKEREADDDLAAGRVTRYESDEDFLAALDEHLNRWMPTRDVFASFWRDWDRLTPEQQREFRRAVQQFIADLTGGGRDSICACVSSELSWRRRGARLQSGR